MAKLWAVVDERGLLWFTRIDTDIGVRKGNRLGTTDYEVSLHRAAIFETQSHAEEWATRNPFRQTGEVYKVIEVEVDGVKLR